MFSQHTYTLAEILLLASPAILSMIILIAILTIMVTRRADSDEMRRLTERIRHMEDKRAGDSEKLAAADRQLFYMGRMISMLADLVVESGLILPAEVQEYLSQFNGQPIALDNSEQHAQLLHILDKFFSEGEIHELAFKLGVDFENLPGDRKIDKAQSLIYYLSRRGRLGKLITAVREERPNLPWMGGRGPP